MQVVRQSPVILLDGAHSPTSAEALCKAIREVFCYKRLIFVVGPDARQRPTSDW